ncbi:MAG: hypothetical protein ABIE94_04055 [archaeon]
MKTKLLLATILLSVMILISACDGLTFQNGGTGGSGGTTPSADAVPVEFYVMSQCPYGTQVVDAVAPVLEQLGPNVDFHLDFIARAQGDGFTSLHGQPEVDGNIAQLCAIEHEPAKYMEMIVCMNKNMQSIPGNWESCAEENDLDVSSIKTCYEGEEGEQLLTDSIAKATARQATGSPTIYIGGTKYSGSRTEAAFTTAICNAFTGDKPEVCSDIPEPVAVKAMVITDSRCASCNTANVESQLRGIFPGVQFQKYDYGTTEGKALYDSADIKLLPAVLFDETVTKGAGYSNVQNFLDKAGNYYSLRIGASFDPTREICDNNKDDTDNDLVDCDDPDCTGSMECREEKAGNLQVFIMSDCPYGRKAVEALYEVTGNFGDAMNYEVHYIASEQGDGFSSLHGQYEVDENIIQLCVLEHSPDMWMEYMYCRATDGVKGKDWNECAASSKVDVEAVQTCFDSGEGTGLLREDITLAQGLGVSASPTWMANNRYQFSGIDAETVRSNFCQYNEITGCEATLTGNTGTPSGSC